MNEPETLAHEVAKQHLWDGDAEYIVRHNTQEIAKAITQAVTESDQEWEAMLRAAGLVVLGGKITSLTKLKPPPEEKWAKAFGPNDECLQLGNTAFTVNISAELVAGMINAKLAAFREQLEHRLTPTGKCRICDQPEARCDAHRSPQNQPTYAELREQLAQAQRQIEMDTECIERIRNTAMRLELDLAQAQAALKQMRGALKLTRQNLDNSMAHGQLIGEIIDPAIAIQSDTAALDAVVAAETARLRAALEPFATLARKFDVEPYWADYPDRMSLSGNKVVADQARFLTLGDCRKAKAAMQQQPGGKR